MEGEYINLDIKDTWPENCKQNLKVISNTANLFEIEYTYSKDDITYSNAHKADTYFPFQVMAVYDYEKLPDNYEAQYMNRTYLTEVLVNGVAQSTKTYLSHNYTDKKTVELNTAIAPIEGSNVGTYNTDLNKITYLKAGDKARIKMTVTRPVGILPSGDVTVDGTIPNGMTYVTGSANFGTDSTITATIDDTSGAPQFKFTDLPVGKTVTITYDVEASTVTKNLKTNVNSSMINEYQKELVGHEYHNQYPSTNLYSENEYKTNSVKLPIVINAQYTINFDSKGGSTTPETQFVNNGEKATAVTDPTKSNKFGECKFDGWYYLDENGKEVKFDFDTPITKDYNLYAKYKEPNLVLSVSADKDVYKPNEKVTYTIDVTNSGTYISKGGKVSFTIPEGMSVVDLAGGELSEDGKTIVYDFNGIDAGKKTTFKPVLMVPSNAKKGDKFDAIVSISSIDDQTTTGIETSVEVDIDDTNTTTNKTVDTTVKTGDASNIGVYMMLAACALFSLLVLKKKKA